MSTETFSQTIENFAEGFLGSKPLFSNGVQIGNWSVGGGYFDTNAQDVMSGLCNQVVSFYPSVTDAQKDPTTWTTINDWGVSIGVQDYCLQKAVIPNWMTQDQLNQYTTTVGGSIVPVQSSLIVPLAIAGGLVALALLIGRR